MTVLIIFRGLCVPSLWPNILRFFCAFVYMPKCNFGPQNSDSFNKHIYYTQIASFDIKNSSAQEKNIKP